MTIIEPNKKRKAFNLTTFFSTIILTGLVFSTIYFYNENVSFRHSISSYSKELQKIKVDNAEYKNQLYKITELENLEYLIKESGLVKEEDAEYRELKNDALASINF